MTDFKPSLADIAALHHSDKGLFGPSDMWNGNNYVDTYEAYLRDRKDEPLKLMEIGIGVPGPNWDAQIAQGRNQQGGASLKMWLDYLPNAEIWALDINPAKHLDTDRAKTFVVDQGSRKELGAFRDAAKGEQFDIIIDDGSHRGDHQQISLEMLWPMLKSGGLYIIEDLNDRGFGERNSGRHVSADTVSTRRFFLELMANGDIIAPNALENTDFLEEIADIRFHTPVPLQSMKWVAIEVARQAMGKAKRGVMSTKFAPNSFKMVVLKKA